MGLSETRLEKWLVANAVERDEIRYWSGLSRQFLTRLRWGKSDVCLRTMQRILHAAQKVKGEHVRMDDLFDLGPSEPTTRD